MQTNEWKIKLENKAKNDELHKQVKELKDQAKGESA